MPWSWQRHVLDEVASFVCWSSSWGRIEKLLRNSNNHDISANGCRIFECMKLDISVFAANFLADFMLGSRVTKLRK